MLKIIQNFGSTRRNRKLFKFFSKDGCKNCLKKNLLTQSLQEVYDLKPDNFNATSHYYYSAIKNKDYNLQLKENFKSNLAKVSLDDFKQFYEKLFLDDKTTRKF